VQVHCRSGAYGSTLCSVHAIPRSFCQANENTFSVIDGATAYPVNLLLDQCSSPKGINGGPCEHQFAAYEVHGQLSVNIVPQSSAE